MVERLKLINKLKTMKNNNYEALRRAVYTYTKQVGIIQYAEDIINDLFIRFEEKGWPEQVVPYTKLCITHKNSLTKYKNRVEEWDEKMDTLDLVDYKFVIEDLVTRLCEEDKEMIFVYLERGRYTDVATKYGIHNTTAKNKVQKIINTLKGMISDYEELL